MTPTPLTRSDLAAFLAQATQALRQEGEDIRTAAERIARTGEVSPADWAALARSQEAQVRIPASVLLLLAGHLTHGSGPVLPAPALSHFLLEQAQDLRRSADALLPLRRRTRGDLREVVDAIRTGLLEQAARNLMLATWLEGASSRG